VLFPQSPIQIQDRPAIQHDRRRDPALRQVRLEQQITHQPRIAPGRSWPASLGPRLAEVSAGSPQVHPRPRGDKFLGHIPPPRTSLHRERDIVTTAEPLRQPPPQLVSIRRRDHPTPHPSRLRIHIVEGDLSTMDVQPAYD
jgi:hypothetical protein